MAVIIFLLGLAVLGFAIVNSRMTGVGEEYFSMAVTGVATMIGAFFSNSSGLDARMGCFCAYPVAK